MTFKIPQEEALLGERELRNVKFKKQNEGYASSTQADQGSVIEFIPMHFKNTPVITFLAFLDDIKDNIKQTFTPQQPYGRSDPIQVWKSSDRVITLSFKIDKNNPVKIGDTHCPNVLPSVIYVLRSLFVVFIMCILYVHFILKINVLAINSNGLFL